MPYQATVYNVFIASPSDVRPEREIARQVIYEWNAAHAESEKAVLQPIGWETHSYPEMGERPQEIINRLVTKSDILVSIFRSRLGSPTGVAASGTIEEIEKHREAKKPTMIYFSNAAIPHDVDTKQFEEVRKLREKYESEGLIGTFADSEDFRRVFTQDLATSMVEYLKARRSDNAIRVSIDLKSQPSSESNWQERPILEIQDLAIKRQFAAEKGSHFILSFMIANLGNVVCQSHRVTIRIPLKFGSTPVIIDDEQPPLNGRVSHYVDTESQSTAYVLEIRGGKIYSGDKVAKALRILTGVTFDDRMNAFCSRTEDKVTIALFSDPPSEVKGQTQITP